MVMLIVVMEMMKLLNFVRVSYHENGLTYSSPILTHDCMLILLQISAGTHIMVAVPSPGSVYPLRLIFSVQDA
jgi:hypothetical protein